MLKVSDVLAPIPREELAKLLEKSDRKAGVILLVNWLMIAGCFVLVFYSPTSWAWILAAAILGGRQLGLAILMHDCSHNAFFKTPALNLFFGKWFCAAPVMADLDRYRTYHLEHHRTAGSDQDPDRPNYVNYPVTLQSLGRKFARDLSGLTGLKVTYLVILMNAGVVKYQLSYDGSRKAEGISFSQKIKNLLRGLGPTMIFHAALLGIFLLVKRPELYLLWWFGWLTFYMLYSRIRNAAEHGAPVDLHDLDPFLNTRTTIAGWWEKLTVAPNRVNYHLEHHVLPAVPSYHLPIFHGWLRKSGHYEKAKLAHGYREVLRDLTSSKKVD